ncbi:MAG: hypothetical protein HY587_03570 [Candidatus Omnitrophica bacterium]|nr:hypothetical protein [Candidatus Omnitrophota bacterium]
MTEFLKFHYVIVSSLIFASSIFLSLFVYLKAGNRSLLHVYSFWVLCVGLWCFFLVLNILAPSQSQALIWCRLLHVWAIILPSVYVHFVLLLIDKYDARKNLVRFLYFLSFVFIVIAFTPWFLSSSYREKFGFFVSEPKILYPIHLAIFLGSVTYVYYELISHILNSSGLKQKQTKYFFIATVSAYSGGITNYLINYDVRIVPLYPFANYGVLIYIILVAGLILRYRFLDIEVLIKRTIVFAGLFGMVMVVVTAVTAALQTYVGQYLSHMPVLSMALSGLMIILLYEPAKNFLVRVTDKFLFQRGYSYDEIQDEIASCSEITDLNQLSQRIAEIFYSKMVLESVRLLLYEKDGGAFRATTSWGTSSPKEKVSASEPPFDLILRAEEKVIRTDDLQTLQEGLKSVELVVKISYQEELIALLLLGKKKSDKDYSNDDIRFFEITAKHIANIINIAKMFHFQRDYYALQAEKNRGDMLAQLSAGLDHEIKNPLNQSMPRMQMIMYEAKKAFERGADERVLHKIIDLAETAYKHDERIVAIMSRLRRFSRPIPERERIELKPLNLLTSVREAVGLISERRLQDDSVTLECNVPGNLYVLADETLLVQTLYNVINNAYHAINRHGTITVGASMVNQASRVRISIQDTGHGIKPEHISKIFEPFFTTKPTNPQGDDAHRFRGTGLGLGLVKRYMEECGGSISFETEVGKGTTFYLEFGYASPPLKESASPNSRNLARTG